MDTFLWAVSPGFTTAFEVWGSGVTWLEIVALGLSVAMVLCNLRVHVAGWPLAITSSLLYALLFYHYRLYGEAGLQLVFVTMSAWGWWQWLRPSRSPSSVHGVSSLSRQQQWATLVVTLAAWPLLGGLLSRVSDSDVPYLDALPTVASLTGQWLLARKRVENWVVWLGVNLFSVGLFAYKHLWLTACLYALFAGLSWVGWRRWSQWLRTARTAGDV